MTIPVYPDRSVSDLSAYNFLGRASISHQEVTAGEWTEIIITYEVGVAGLADGAGIKIAFKFYSDWGLFQTSDASADHYLSAHYLPRAAAKGESPATVRSLHVRFDQKGHERPFQKAIFVDAVDGYLKAGDRIEVHLGDRSGGGRGTRVQTFAEDDFRFRVFVDNAGSSRFAKLRDDLVVRVKAGPVDHGLLLSPRVVRPGITFPVTVRWQDRWGNPAGVESLPPLHIAGTGDVSWRDIGATWARARIKLETPGAYQLELKNTSIPVESTWITVTEKLSVTRALFADLHIHSEDTVGVNSTESNLTAARDDAGLDIAGYTANDFNVRADRWAHAVEVCRSLHQPGTFLCFPGTEWCGASSVGGDRNVIFLGDEVRFPLGPDGRLLRVFEWNEDTANKQTQEPGLTTARDLHEAYRDMGENVLLIPHVGGRRANFDWHDPQIERLIEVASSWGHFDWFYREALSRGYRVGVSAAGDEHRGRPGGGAPGVGSFGVRGGLTGVLAETLQVADVTRALNNRHTWATTGTRIVALIRSEKHIQGGVFSAAGPVVVEYDLYGQAGWEWIELRDDQGVLLTRNLHHEVGYSSNRFRIRWGGARIPDRYRWAEWRGEIRITGAVIRSWHAAGLEHPEETIQSPAPGVFVVSTDTYGDADHLEIEVDSLENLTVHIDLKIGAFRKTSDARTFHPDPLSPEIRASVTGGDIVKNENIRFPLSGCELFAAIERVTDRDLPREVHGRFEVEPRRGPHAHRSIYLFAREQNDDKVWTSPLFVEYQQYS